MALINGSDYEHIDINDGSDITRHYLKDYRVPTLPDDSSKFFCGDGTWATPPTISIIYDNTPEENSINAVTSHGIKEYVDNSLVSLKDGMVINDQFVQYATKAGLDNVTSSVSNLTQQQNVLNLSVNDIGRLLSAYFNFQESGIEIGKNDTNYHTETSNEGFRVLHGTGSNKLCIALITTDETAIPAFRAEDNLYIGRPENGCLEWYRCYNGYGLRHVQPVTEGSGN